MKKIIALIMSAMLSIAIPINSYAGPKPTTDKMIVKIKKGSETNSIDVYLANLQGKRTLVSLQDIDGRVWFSEYVWGERGYGKKLNMNGMPDGNYLLFVKNDKGFKASVFAVNNGDLSFYDREKVDDNKPIASLVKFPNQKRGALLYQFALEGNHVLKVRMANLEGKPVKILLNTLGGGVIFKENLEDEIGYAKKFNTTGMSTDYGYFFVSVGKERFVQFFQIGKKGVVLINTIQKWHPISTTEKLIVENR